MKKSSIWKKLLMVLGALVAVVAIVAASVYGTIAYLTSGAVIQNSFSVGHVGITMTEAAVDKNGHAIGPDEQGNVPARVEHNKYTLVAGADFDKDPTIFVNEESQNSYLFIIIRNDLTQTSFAKNGTYGKVEITKTGEVFNTIEANDKAHEKPTILDQVLANGWLPYARVATGNVYVYAGLVDDTENGGKKPAADASHVSAGDTIKVFSKLHITGDIDEKGLRPYGMAQLNVRAFAIQDTGFKNDETGLAVDKAWAALLEEYSSSIHGVDPTA